VTAPLNCCVGIRPAFLTLLNNTYQIKKAEERCVSLNGCERLEKRYWCLQFHPASIVSMTIAIAEPSPVRHDLPVRRSILLNFRPPPYILMLFNLF
jgi:hypothetical protein